MEAKELTRRLDAVKITGAGVNLNVPRHIRKRDVLNEPVKKKHRSDVSQFLLPWVTLDAGGRPVRVNPDVNEKRIQRRVLREVGGGTNLNVFRSPVARAAISRLLIRIYGARIRAWEEMDVDTLEKRASSILRKREAQDRMDDQVKALNRVRKELLGPLQGISEQEVVDLYRECQVKTVMES